MKSAEGKFFIVIHCLLFYVMCSVPLFAWPMVNGIAISTVSNEQQRPTIVSDGAGGAIITWYDYRSTTGNPTQGADIYVHRVNSTGSTLWSLDGVALCTAINNQFDHTSINDGAGGAIVTWEDLRNTTGNPAQGSDIYAQKVNSNGSTLWTLDGVAICTAGNSQYYPAIASDSSGGAIITWRDYRSYAQRVDSNGVPQWTLNGVAICTAGSSAQFNPQIVSDGSGGAIITWEDYRDGNSDIYAQRLNSMGSTLWTLNGVAISTEGNDQFNPTIVSDGSGGAIITWWDQRNPGYDIYAQRVDSSGSTLWTLNGIAICTAGNDQYFPAILSDSSGGAIITWFDYRNDTSSHTNSDIYVQRVDPSGSTLWTLDGVALCTAKNGQYNTTITSNGAGGALITWWDQRNPGGYDIYAQGVDSSGVPQWTLDGVAICTAGNDQYYPTIVSDSSGGAIITWFDYRDDVGSYTNSDIYAQRVGSDGNTNFVPVELSRFETLVGIKE